MSRRYCCFCRPPLSTLTILVFSYLPSDSFGPPRRDTFDDKDIGKAEGEPQPLSGILLIEAVKARAAVDVAAIATAQAELPNNSIDSKEVSALIEGNGDDIGEVDAVDELHWM